MSADVDMRLVGRVMIRLAWMGPYAGRETLAVIGDLPVGGTGADCASVALERVSMLPSDFGAPEAGLTTALSNLPLGLAVGKAVRVREVQSDVSSFPYDCPVSSACSSTFSSPQS